MKHNRSFCARPELYEEIKEPLNDLHAEMVLNRKGGSLLKKSPLELTKEGSRKHGRPKIACIAGFGKPGMGAGGANMSRRDNGIIGKSVRIKQGPLKTISGDMSRIACLGDGTP
ncbi:hypothetical protein TELCIR_09228 [Teladorsagia circumcincta]|uniref:Uncharacterized protein n=1 Tax=Teladorsagia circumcincta TaxID=45464 RepID=A0A2G9UFE1_TELCI|nr:hypothetical protein TELCIR_09228 [Teladorsagia circumcincta]